MNRTSKPRDKKKLDPLTGKRSSPSTSKSKPQNIVTITEMSRKEFESYMNRGQEICDEDDYTDTDGSDVYTEESSEESTTECVPIDQIPSSRNCSPDEQKTILDMIEARFKELHDQGVRLKTKPTNQDEKELLALYHRRRRLVNKNSERQPKFWEL